LQTHFRKSGFAGNITFEQTGEKNGLFRAFSQKHRPVLSSPCKAEKNHFGGFGKPFRCLWKNIEMVLENYRIPFPKTSK
jgi:hypothetical protein